ncbi:MAG: PLP-dependent aspartate aminotransferase family protein [Candidatus Cellulosilyticum pullistercoris]|uniref:PLP-dependent aspartate aminotransferase family protein n=1 Tax=Candidatus Cellulosilyticum pullistercoris TaxID=2838521 RepID=A0A9E2KBE3_9FIRM|nr:PLP-dependent aspartate aminotransferase family protein [Candidatus Cellulosilyticum pullistercoris]
MAYQTHTICVQGSKKRKEVEHTGAISFPIYQTASYAHVELGESTGYDYSRLQNPTREEVERIIADLEHGIDALAFSTGMAAINALMELFKPGDHIIATDDLYGGTIRLFNGINTKNGLNFSYVDSSKVENVEAAIKENTRAIYIETPTNPMMKVTDLSAMARLASEHGCLLIVDNTFLTPYYQNPLDLGADIVVHSGTKYLGGHNDTLAGFLVTNKESISEQLRYIIKTTGAGLAPMDSWLILRGIKTLAIRMEKHEQNALAIAKWLKSQKKVKEVYYIGLPEHESFEVTQKQCRGYGGMLSFRVEDADTAKRILKKVNLIRFAESLGGVESLITFPKYQTHADVPEEVQKSLGIDDTLLRLSVGIEAVEDLIEDLAQALAE